jgi:Leucine-rich repeat (LRR) protein
MSPEYQGVNLDDPEQAFMVELEKLVGKPIPFMTKINYTADLGFSGSNRHISHLLIKNQGISQLPADIDRLSLLEVLHLNSNKLTNFPKGIEKLTNLQYLELGYNQITKLPSSIIKLKIKTYFGVLNNPLSPMTKSVKKWLKALQKKGCGVFL